MASEVDICNQALSSLGDKATVVSISPPDRSVQAELCARFYPMARDELLEAHDWGFARARVAGALLAVPPPGFAYAYAYPADCLVVRAVSQATPTMGPEAKEFETGAVDGTRAVLSQVPSAQIFYTRALTDTTKFTPLFTGALVVSLAARVAGPLIQGREGRAVAADMLKLFRTYSLPAAINAESGSRLGTVQHTPVWLEDR